MRIDPSIFASDSTLIYRLFSPFISERHETLITIDTRLPIFGMLGTESLQTKRLPLHVHNVKSCKLYNINVYIFWAFLRQRLGALGYFIWKIHWIGHNQILILNRLKLLCSLWSIKCTHHDFIARVVTTTYTLVKLQNRLMTKWTTKKVRKAH